MTSDGRFFPRLVARSRVRFTERIRASFSMDDGSCGASPTRSMRAWRYGRSERYSVTRARQTPCTSTRIRSSGSLSIRMMTATVPTSNRSLAVGSSSSLSFWATSRIIRFSDSARSTAWIESSLATESGAMMNG